MRKASQAIFAILLLTALGLVFWQHQSLPERVATHFDSSGKPNGWLARDTHSLLQVITLLFMTAIFQGIAFYQKKLPKEYVNIPSRDYWLSAKRAPATHAWISQSVILLGCTTIAFFAGLFRLVYLANLASEPRLSAHVWLYVTSLLVVVVGIVITMVLRFRKPSSA